MPKVFLLSHHGKYLAADGSKVNLDEHRYAYSTWDLVPTGKDDVFHLKNEKSGKYLTCENNGNLMNDRTSPGEWESWTISNTKDGRIALKSGGNKKFLCDEKGTLVVNRDKADIWESFICVIHPGKYQLKNASTNLYLCAETNLTLSADRDSPQQWETFTFEINDTPKGVRNTIKTFHGKYICAQPDGRAVADRDHAGEREYFSVQSGKNGLALSTWETKFLQAETKGKIECDSKTDGLKETWQITEVTTPVA
jgi:hypothetical protein